MASEAQGEGWGYGIDPALKNGVSEEFTITINAENARHEIPTVRPNPVLEHLHRYAYVYVESKSAWQWVCRCGQPKPCG